MDILPQKRCTKCGETKPLTEFHKDTKRKDGLHPWCGQCKRSYAYNYVRDPAFKQKNRDRRAANLDRAREYSRNWHKAHKTESREIQRKWRQTPNGKRYALHHSYLRRAQTKTGDVTTAQLRELSERQAHCAYCKRKFTAKLLATIDHVIPVSKGGLHTISNIVLACKSCNSRKNGTITHLI